jgi:quaternary ammonium compound-resistance protein SugE
LNPWIIVAIAGVMETGWALGLKYSEGFTKLVPTVVTVVLALGSFYLLSVAMKSLPVGTAYAVWVGIGVVGVALVGMAALGEAVSLSRLGFIALILVGIVGLKLADG